jgi:hypothetical protein
MDFVAEAPSSAIARFERIFLELDQSGEEVAVAKMYGIICIKAGGKAIGGLDLDGAMVFKLAPDDREAALALAGARVFDPTGKRPMKAWVVVPATHANFWEVFARQALDYRFPQPRPS